MAIENRQSGETTSEIDSLTLLKLSLHCFPGCNDKKLEYCLAGLPLLIERSVLTVEQAEKIGANRLARIENVQKLAINKARAKTRSQGENDNYRIIGQHAVLSFIEAHTPKLDYAAQRLTTRRPQNMLEDQG